MSPALARCVPAGAAVALFCALAALYLGGYPALYHETIAWLGVHAFDTPFVDTHAVLSAIECHRLGVDVYAVNPCDVLGRPHVYSPIWLYGDRLPIDTTATGMVGLVLDLSFLGGLFVLPPAHRRVDIVFMTLACVSTMVVFALERANNDIVVWVLAFMAVSLVQRGPAFRLVGYAFAWFATLLKLYPLVLLIVAIQEKPRKLLMVTAVFLAALGLVIWADLANWQRMIAGVPTVMQGYDMFGATNLPYGVGEVLARHGLTGHWVPVLLGTVCLLYALSLTVRLFLELDLRQQMTVLPARERLLLIAGSALIVGCFFAGTNVLYRGIHFLFVLPGVLILWRGAGQEARSVFGALAVAIVVLMWSESLRYALVQISHVLDLSAYRQQTLEILLWAIRELVWWWVISMLAAVLLALVLVSPSGRWAMRFWPMRR